MSGLKRGRGMAREAPRVLPAPQDQDKDGMPDEWEVAKGLNPNVADHNKRNLSTGYDNLEVYLNSIK